MTRAETILERGLSRMPVGIRTNPFEALIAVLGVVSGSLYLAGVAQSSALGEDLPSWAQRVWGLVMIVACGFMLQGLLRMVDRGGIVSMLGRAVAGYKLGLRLLICVCCIYAPAVMIYASRNGYAAALPYVGLALAASIRLMVLRVSAARTPGWHR